ncbi:MAG: NADH-quinone oxidoreductase subunit C [Candidatus Bathyarchaeia archaeon]
MAICCTSLYLIVCFSKEAIKLGDPFHNREEEIAEELKKAFGEKIIDTKIQRKGRIFISVPTESYKDLIKYLVEKMQIIHVSTITGIDSGEKIEVMPHLFGRGSEITVKVAIPKEKPEIDTITDILPGASLYEREVHDLLGVVFVGHPNLERLILPEDWPEGVYPLRKDYKRR